MPSDKLRHAALVAALIRNESIRSGHDELQADRLEVVRLVRELKARTPLSFDRVSDEDILRAITKGPTDAAE